MSNHPLPRGVRNTYREYSVHCHHVIRYVVTTASKLRAAAANRGSQAASRNPKKKKGRREKNSSEADLDSPEPSINQFLRLAKDIATASVQAPAGVLARVAAIIDGRKTLATFYSSDADASRSNTGHLYAIQVYTEVFQLLGGQTGDDSTDVAIQRFLENLSADATTEEKTFLADNEWLRDIPAIAKLDSTKPTKQFPLGAYKLALGDDCGKADKSQSGSFISEKTFAALCFFRDVAVVREHLSTVWKQVEPVGRYSRVTASFVTNQAMTMVRELQYEMFEDFPDFKDVGKLYDSVFEQMNKSTMNRPENTTAEQLDAVGRHLMLDTHMTLKRHVKALKNGLDWDKKAPTFVFNPSLDRAKMGALLQFAEDQMLFHAHVYDTWLLNQPVVQNREFPCGQIMTDGLGHDVGSERIFFGDEEGAVKELTRLSKSKGKSLDMVTICAVNLWMESVQIRRNYLDADMRAMRQLQNIIEFEIDRTLDHDLQWLPSDGPKHKIGREDVKIQLDAVRSILNDHLKIDWLSQIKKDGFTYIYEEHNQKDSLNRFSPWRTFNLMSFAMGVAWKQSILMISVSGFVVSTMHLWNYLKVFGYLDSSPNAHKKEMLVNHLINIFGPWVYCDKNPPKDADLLVKRYLLVYGMSVRAFAKDGDRDRKIVVSDIDIPSFSRLTSILLEFANPKMRRNKHTKNFTLGSSIASKLYENHYALDGKELAKLDPRKASAVGTLEATANIVERELGRVDGELPIFNLNIFRIHRLCTKLFERLNKLLKPLFRALPGDLVNACFGQTMDRLSFLTLLILGLSSDPINIRAMQGQSSLMRKVAAIVLEVFGDEFAGDYLLLRNGDPGKCMVLTRGKSRHSNADGGSGSEESSFEREFAEQLRKAFSST